MATITHLHLLLLFTLTLLVQAKPNLNTADHHALLTILQDLGVSDDLRRRDNLCDTAGILFSDCRKLEVVNLRHNRFSGEVPAEISHLLRLRVLDLSSNEFSVDLGFLKFFPNLEKLSLENMFTGKVPWRYNQSGPSIFSPSIKAEELAFLDDDDAVAALQVIGRGGCGQVYKTDIPNRKIKTIAVKRIIQPSKDAVELTAEDTKMLNRKMRQIRSEIQTVGQIRHRNLLALLAHFSRPTCHYLVYEFMKNGSLQDILLQVKAGT
ncbi:hypothetical protein L1987_48112 [Smallanthus sonchifolius]|uniref:Uncharacterized protein n=1 Tax=Smallanthus sonchifolius TaxID=185202 RepID=A0ACB9FQW8_9ASTR|nr:hypothetical protein L1987_48112 [Smallanthus sonchifolius]